MPFCKKQTILVVEDEIILLEAIIEKLRTIGFTVVSCRTVKQAKNLIKDIASIDAVWLDHYLPGGDGLTFARYMKRAIKFSHIPIFLVSAVDNHEILDAYNAEGICRFYPKVTSSLDYITRDISHCLKNRK